ILATNGTKGGLIESEPVTITETASGNNYQVQVATAGWFEDIQTPLMSLTLNPDPVKQGEELNIGAVISNPSSERISNLELRLHYPDHLNSIYTQYITTGGAANSVSCIGDTPTNHCESGETVVWIIGAIPAGEGISVNMKPTVPTAYYVDAGTIIQFDAELWVDGIQQQTITKSVPVQSQPFFELYVSEQNKPYDVA
ncbi:MAG: hypothetical protein GY702_06835, partial [Desulfobulbaceae bacterium]|nr:hypothetical protein [Desulfobulbaceae bacterium]